MEGPTPVSALLHAATMVTAGVYLLVRCSFFLSLSGEVNTFLVWWGTLTICYAGLVGFFQYDIKRIIAYSTCSQLGYMFVACGLLNPNLAFFHLFNHAFFKAALFLSAGLIIHLNQGEQDLRKMQTPVSLNYIEVFVIVANLLANFSLMGLPFFSGYYSKDLIMFCAGSNNVLTGLLIIGAIITVGYSLKLFYYLFNAKKIKLSSKLVSLDYVKDALFFEGLFPISFLLILSVLSGLTISYFMPYFIYVYSPGQSYVPGSIESYVTGISNQPKLAPLVFFLLLVVSVSFYLWL